MGINEALEAVFISEDVPFSAKAGNGGIIHYSVQEGVDLADRAAAKDVGPVVPSEALVLLLNTLASRPEILDLLAGASVFDISGHGQRQRGEPVVYAYA